MKKRLILSFLCCLFSVAAAAQSSKVIRLTEQDMREQSNEAIEAKLPHADMAGPFLYSMKRFDEGDIKASMKWWFVAILRAEIYVLFRADDPDAAEQAQAQVIALYESADPMLRDYRKFERTQSQIMADAITEALDWDVAHENALTPNASSLAISTQIRAQLEEVRATVFQGE